MSSEERTCRSAITFDPEACRARVVLERIADKWSLYVVAVLNDGERRFTEIKRAIDGVSQRMLTVTLRELERDGIVTRTIYNAMPPNIAYRLTPLGESMSAAIVPLISWASMHHDDIEDARESFDARPL